MKASIGNAFVSGVVIMFLFLTILILTFAINYSRANKIKNKLLNYVANYAEKYSNIEGNNITTIDINDPKFVEGIESELASVGYRRNKGLTMENKCTKEKSGGTPLTGSQNYHYCIYAYETERGYYYGVETFMYLDIPIVGYTLEFPLYGETRVIYDLGDRGGKKS